MEKRIFSVLFLISLIIFAGFWLFKDKNHSIINNISEKILAQSCSDECSYQGQNSCDGSYILKTCGDYDSDSCLEWKEEACRYGCTGNPGGYYCKASLPECCPRGMVCPPEQPPCCIDGSCYRSQLGFFRCEGQNLAVCADIADSCNWTIVKYCPNQNTVCGTEGCSSDKKPIFQCNSSAGEPNQPPCILSSCFLDPTCCTSECFQGETRCINGQTKQICDNYDADNCFEWGGNVQCLGSTACGYGTCQDNQLPVWSCSNNDCNYTCQTDEIACGRDECPYGGATQCYDSVTKQVCGQAPNDPDPYLEWINTSCLGSTACGSSGCQTNQKPIWSCSNGSCVVNCVNDNNCCGAECLYEGETKCQDSKTKQTCGYWDLDVCLEWSSSEDCVKNSSCGFGTCKDTEKPVWACEGQGICEYDCVQDSSCQVARNCTDECSPEGTEQCSDATHSKSCGYFDTDVCLDWSPSKLCSGSTACGALTCQANQKPQWKCSSGGCDYTCIAASECGGSISPSPSPTCQDECSSKGGTRCASETMVQVCDSNFDSDPCLEWGSNQPCQGDTACGSQGCSSKQKPSWSCSNNQCAFRCVDDESCAQNGGSAVCGDLICDQGENASCPQDCVASNFTISLATKKEKGVDWQEAFSYQPKEKFDVRIIVKNNSQRDFAAVSVRAEIPQELTYEKDLKVDGSSSRSDIRFGLDLGFFPANTEKSITFKASASSKITTQTETEIIGTVEAENLTATASSKITVEKPSAGAKWYVWLLSILIIVAIVGGFLFLRARAQSQL